MKKPEDWGADEWCATALLGLVGLGVWRAVRSWWSRRGPEWLQEHDVLLAPGQGLVDLGAVGAIDAPRIMICALVLIVGWILARSAAASELARRKQAQDRGGVDPEASRGQRAS